MTLCVYHGVSLSIGLFESLRREAQTEPSHRLGGSVAAAQPNL